jgi:carboxylate-amine ligase
MYSFGIEEEFFLVDTETREVARRSPERMFTEAKELSGARIGREFLESQIETATRPCNTLDEAREQVAELRGMVKTVAARHGMSFLACGTHPTAVWRGSVQSRKRRYDAIMGDLQMIGKRNMFCGMHVHVELPEPSRRFEMMCAMVPYVPLFLALSTSSPFWQSHSTGLKSYRLAAYDELPRTGLPELIRTQSDYDAYVGALTKAGAIKDASHIWWSLRPSLKYPTLELRAADCCTRAEDTVAIAALYRVLVRYLFERAPFTGVDSVARAIAGENLWRAKRNGIGATFITAAGAVPVPEFLHHVAEMIAEDAEILECGDAIARCKEIASEGTSADAQVAIFENHLPGGADAAFAEVVEWIDRTTSG